MVASTNQAVHNPQAGYGDSFQIVKTANSERMQIWCNRLSYTILIVPPAIGLPLLLMIAPEAFPASAFALQMLTQVVFSLVAFRRVQIVLRQLGNLTYSLESGFLIARLDSARVLFRVNLSKVTKVEVGNDGSPDKIQMRLVSPWRLPVVVPALDDMEEFIAKVAALVPVEIKQRSKPLSIWTRQSVASTALCLVILIVLFTGSIYALTHIF